VAVANAKPGALRPHPAPNNFSRQASQVDRLPFLYLTFPLTSFILPTHQHQILPIYLMPTFSLSFLLIVVVIELLVLIIGQEPLPVGRQVRDC
jgi:hypothetical protein